MSQDALGDDPKQPRYIETVHRRGYRFLPSAGPPGSSAPRTPSSGARRSSRRCLGFVVSSNTVRRLLLDRSLMWAGVDGRLVAGEMGRAFKVPQPAGYLVTLVARGSGGQEMSVTVLRAGRVVELKASRPK